MGLHFRFESAFRSGQFCPMFEQPKDNFLVYVGRNRKMTKDVSFSSCGFRRVDLKAALPKTSRRSETTERETEGAAEVAKHDLDIRRLVR